MSEVLGQEPLPRPQSRRHRGRWWRWPATALILLVEGVMLLLAIGGVMLAWRAAQGPVDGSWLLPRIGRIIAVAAPELDVSIDHFAIAWKGFTEGPDQPVQLTAAGIRVADSRRQRSIAIGHAGVDLSAAWAVRGVVAPRVVVLQDPVITLRRPPAGISVTAPPTVPRQMTAHDIIAVLEQPPQTDRHLVMVKPAALSELTRLTVTGGTVLVEPASDPASTGAKTLRASDIAADVTRGAAGGLAGHVSAILSVLGAGQPAQADPANFAQTPTMSGNVTISRSGSVHIQAQAKVDDPDGLMAVLALPEGAPLPTMPLQATADVTTDAAFVPTAIRARLVGGSGQIAAEGGTIPVTGVVLGLSGNSEQLVIDPGSHIAFGAVSAQPPPTVTLNGSAQFPDGGMTGAVTLGIDHLATDDLPAYWPPGIARDARNWIKAQVHGGLLHDGAFELGLKSGPDPASLAVVSAGGLLPATGLSVAWLPPVPPLTNVMGSIALTGTDSVGITVNRAQQGDLGVSDSTMVITGLSAPEQIGTIAVNVTGPVASALAVVNHPRLHLLKTLPVPLAVTAGTATTTVNLSLPLDAKVTFPQIQLKAHSVIQNLALRNILLGRNVTNGALTIDADSASLHLSGSAALANIPTQVTLDADFTGGPPTQVVASLTATATADQVALAAAGIPTGGVLAGTMQAKVSMAALRSGRTDINATLTLPDSHLRVNPISWSGGAGQATASAHLALQGGQIVQLDNISLNAPDAQLQARSTVTDGHLSAVVVDQLVLGRTKLHGSLGLPATAGGAYALTVAGPALDLSNVWGPKPQPSPGPANNVLSSISSKSEFQPHPPWRAQINLDRVLFGTLPNGGSRELDHLQGLAVNNGVIVQSAQVSFSVEPSGSSAHLSVVPDVNGTRNVTLASGDFGGLLKAINAYDMIAGGALRIDGTYNDRLSNHPLSGTIEMDSFTLGDAPTAAKVLAAMTLYGTVDLLHGPGLFFRRMVAPFQLADERLVLSEARAYSASLGLTAHGSVDLPNNRFDIQGTIVPAYFFNSLLGHIPLIGKYFSPEKGGGVFAAKYELVGPIDSPQVHVNPTSLMTPGFLRQFLH